ncbi:unnamed protein product [Mytilus coruscus]|uniref:DDE-1 domain-containing protein n=1 Tax=Mytilus coruscus TaxID=42192 RepID=A0A6J8DFU6_MYTCO|nr:unnamed protein product [Mytilus coruscus]
MERIGDSTFNTKGLNPQSSEEISKRNGTLILNSDCVDNNKRKNNVDSSNTDNDIPQKQARVSKQPKNEIVKEAPYKVITHLKYMIKKGFQKKTERLSTISDLIYTEVDENSTDGTITDIDENSSDRTITDKDENRSDRTITELQVDKSKPLSTSMGSSEIWKTLSTSMGISEKSKTLSTSISSSEKAKTLSTSMGISEKSKTLSTSKGSSEKPKPLPTSKGSSEKSTTLSTSMGSSEKSETLSTSKGSSEKPKPLPTSKGSSDKSTTVSTSMGSSEKSETLSTSKGSSEKSKLYQQAWRKDGQHICTGCDSLFSGEDNQTDGGGNMENEPEVKKEKKHQRYVVYHSRLSGIGWLVDPECTTMGKAPLFTLDEESRLVTHLMDMGELGYGYYRQDVLDIATDYAITLDLKTKDDKPLSLAWFYGMIRRWPDLKVVKQRALEVVKANNANKENISKYFNELENVLLKYNRINKPHLIYNVDEKSVAISGNGETVTILGCGNAIGNALPPFFIFPGQKMDDKKLLEGLHQELLAQSLRLENGHTSHIPVGTFEWARNHNIVLQLIPAHTSHFLHLLDVGCYGLLQDIYNSLCHKTIRTKNCALDHNDVCPMVCKAYKKLSTNNLQSAFRKTGIYPFTKDVMDLPLEPSEALCLSDTANIEESQVGNMIN